MTPPFRDPAERGLLRLSYRNWGPTLLGRVTTRVSAWMTGLGLMQEIVATILVDAPAAAFQAVAADYPVFEVLTPAPP
jgi:hypothetical protein